MINIEQSNNQIKISYIDKNGDIAFKTINLKPSDYFEWRYCDPTRPADMKYADKVYKSWDNKPVKKSKVKYLPQWRVQEIIMDHPEIHADIYAFNKPKKFFVDIETYVPPEGYGAIKAEVAAQPITAISFSHDDLLFVLGTQQLSKEAVGRIEKKINDYVTSHGHQALRFNYVSYETEYDMLYTFMKKWIHKMPIVTGWNFVEFDWQYIVNRCKRLNIDPAISSPSLAMVGPKTGIQSPMHRLVVDYMEIYKKWDRKIFKENNTLEYVATAATGMGKIPYSGTLQDLYNADYEKYVYYNAIDSVLVNLIDKEISTMSTFFALGNAVHIEANQAFSSIALATTAMCWEAYRRKKVIPTTFEKAERQAYEGAFVFKPIPGIYDWVASFDFASLYPSIMRQWNMSPESYLGNIKELGEQVKNDPNIITSKTGACFDATEDSLFRSILTNYYGQRKEAKKVMHAAEEEIARLSKIKEAKLGGK